MKMKRNKTWVLKQRAELIIKNPNFQKAILDLRKKWGIPTKGFNSRDEKHNWESSLVKIYEKYFVSKQFKEGRKRIDQKRKRLSYKQYTAKQEQEDRISLRPKDPINQLWNDITHLKKKLNLSDYWTEFINWYLKYNKMEIPASNVAIQLKNMSSEKSDKEVEVYLR